jgi:hypothetical protein
LGLNVLFLLSIAVVVIGMGVTAVHDFSVREVDPLLLVFPLGGLVLLVFGDFYLSLPVFALFLFLVGACIILYRFGAFAQGDVFVVPFIAVAFYALPFVLGGIVVLMLVHVVYVRVRYGFKRVVPVGVAKKDIFWIPKAVDGVVLPRSPEAAYVALNGVKDGVLVEEAYGFPLAGYVSGGIVLGIVVWLFVIFAF